MLLSCSVLTCCPSYGVFCQIDERDMTKIVQQRIATLESLCRRCLNFLDDDPEISDDSFERLDQLIDDLREALGMETWAEAHSGDTDEQMGEAFAPMDDWEGIDE